MSTANLVEGDIENNIEIKKAFQEAEKDEVVEYWKNCNSDCRAVAIIVNTAYLYWCIRNFIAPMENT